MRIYKLSLGTDYFDDAKLEVLRSQSLVSVHPDTAAKAQSKQAQGQLFLEANKGDLFYVCRSNQSVELIGIFTDKRPFYSLIKSHESWTDRSYHRLYDAINPTAYDKQLDKWWTPKNNSTFTLIPEGDYDRFEASILQPVFEISLKELKAKRATQLSTFTKTIDDYANLQLDFANLKSDVPLLLKRVNNLDNLELKKIQYTYLQRGDISHQPVVLLRNKLLEELMNGTKITEDLINLIKEEINVDFEKNVYQVWKDPFRILYTFLYDKYKGELIEFFYELIHKIQSDLGIQEYTKINLVHLDGAQNQGYDRIWFAIYNNTYSSQKFAKQLHFVIQDGFEYGLYDAMTKSREKMFKTDHFNYEHLIEVFKAHKQEIINDDSMEKSRIGEYIDILEYKKQIILQGPPGTGKTYSAKKIASQITGNNEEEQVKIIQFHPSFGYEDFIRGITAKSKGGNIFYETENKLLVSFAQKAMDNLMASKKDVNGLSIEEPTLKQYVLIIDEINRANLSSVLGELIYALEYRNEPVESTYTLDGDNTIIIPDNLYIIGTMNTADRSVGHIDYAIRRRFAFVDVLPNQEVINSAKAKALFIMVSDLFVKEENGKKSNSDYLASDFEYKDVQLGHSYFILKEGTEEEQRAELQMRLKYEIIPILHEYIKDGLLLETAKPRIEEIEKFEC